MEKTSPPTEPNQQLPAPKLLMLEPHGISPRKIKILLVGLVLLMILATISAITIFRPKKLTAPTTVEPSPTAEVMEDDMSEWETYQGDGFSFRYPPEMKVEDLTNEKGFYIYKEKGEFNPGIFVSIYTRESSKLWLDNQFNSKDWRYAEISKKTISNKIPVTEVTGILSIYQGDKYSLVEIDESTVLHFHSSDPHYTEILDQILSTFEFTDSAESADSNSETKVYTSEKLGVQFNYKPEYYDSQISVKEIGSKIYVYDTKAPAELGQYLEEFTKDSSDSLEEAIQKQFLAGYSEADCYVVILNNNDGTSMGSNSYPASYQRATISFPSPSDPNEPFFTNGSKCPQPYSRTNGISYFLYDPGHPTKFLFLSIGQYAIDAGINNNTWQGTLRFID